MLEGMWSKGNTPPLLVEVQTCTGTLELSVSVSQKTKNQTTTKSSYTALRQIPKGCSITPQGHILSYVHSSYIYNSQTWKQPRCPSTKEWIKKMCYIYTVEYYAVVKNKHTRKFGSKQIDLENKIILSEVTKIEKDKHGVQLLISGYQL